MLSLSPAGVQATESRRQDLLAAAATARLIDSCETETRRQGAIAGVLRGIAAVLGRAAALVPDSRETIHSKEKDLATLGVTWATDPVRDHEIALELRAARARRQAHWSASPAGEVLETPGTGRGASVPRIRRALDAAFVR